MLASVHGLTLSSDSSAFPSLRLPGLFHCREGFTPLPVVTNRPPPVRRMLPWNTCGDTQGLVRTNPAKQYRMQLHVASNDPSSATAATRRVDCNRDGPLP